LKRQSTTTATMTVFLALYVVTCYCLDTFGCAIGSRHLSQRGTFVLAEILNQNNEDVLAALEYLHDDLDDDLTTDDEDTIIGSSTGTNTVMTTTTNKTLMLTETTTTIMMMRMPIWMPIPQQP
jgi:hypothetical protein